MPSQWLGVGAETDPLRRARELQRSWERLLADGALGLEISPGATAGLRPTIVESWRRSLATGLDPTDVLAPIEVDESEVLDRWFEHPLGSFTQDLMEQLRNVAEESRSMVVVTDASGLVLHREGDESLKERAAEMNLVEGARYSEAADGTNGIGTALAADRAVQVFAFEHFNERHHEWVCSGAPVHDPVSGRVVGLVDLSSLWKTAHPRSLELVTTAARTMERRLFEVRRDHDARLRRRYGDLMTRSTDLLVSRDGYLLAGTEPAHSKPLDIPEGGGEVVRSDGSLAVAASLGQGEAYLLRQVTTRHAKSAPVEVLERAEKHVRELVTEQAALRQVATLVAREPSPDQLFAAVTEQVAHVFDVPHVRMVRYEPEGSVVVGGFSEGGALDEPFPIGSRWPLESPGVTTTVRQTGRPARVEDYAHMTGEIAAVVRGAGMRSTVASPIVVERRLWGAMVVLSPRNEPFPEDTEARLTDFTELVAAAIANAESREALARLAEEQAALRRVAVLVAQQPSPSEVFTAVTQAVGLLLDADLAVLHVFPGDGTATTIASWSGGGPILPIGTRFPLDGDNLAGRIFKSGAPARMHSYDEAWEREATDVAQSFRLRSAVGAPILVEGKLWGALMAATRGVEPWAENAETRIAAFTELAATAIANAESRAAVTRLADEQSALRRVATLVAQGASPQDLFEAVAEEVGRLLLAANVSMGRYEPDASVTSMASWSSTGPVFTAGRRWPIKGTNVAWMVLQTGRPARIDDFSAATDPIGVAVREAGYKSAIGSPIVVEGHLWGAISAASTEGPMPPGSETRLASFTELVATAIANAESQSGLQQLADEQAALRRVATLVAQDAPPAKIFSAVSEEVEGLFGSGAGVLRFEHVPPAVVFVGISSVFDIPIGTGWELQEGMASAEVYRTGRAARVDAKDLAPVGRELGVVSSVAAPIVVEGRLWGAVSLGSTDEQIPPDAEERLMKFTELVATAIANAEGKSELAASRRRIVSASDEARRRIERNLHDGTQQRLVSLGLAVRAAEANLPPEREDLRDELSGVAEGLVDAVEDLQEISRGIHPPILSKGGVGPALRALAHRSPIPVDLDITTDVRLAEPIEVAAYFVVSEALANAAKHSQASRIDVSLERRDGSLVLSVRDDGVGGADAGRGSGIVGLNDRVEALGGSIRVDSRPGKGTQIVARLPLDIELEQTV
jgi:signal transduction histidine kinase